MKKIITTLLIFALAVPDSLPQQPPPPKPKIGLIGCVIGIAVLAGGVILVVGLCKLANKLPQPPVPSATNAMPQSASSGLLPTVDLENSAVSLYNIADAGISGPDGQPYQLMYTLNLESSDDAIHFTNSLTMTGWVSPTWIFSDANGVRTLAPVGSGAVIKLPMSGERKFFRLRK